MLQRFAYGPTPGQVDQLAKQGVMSWFERQLRLDGREDAALASQVKSYEVLELDEIEWAQRYAELRRATRAAREQTQGEGMRAIPERAELRRLLEQVRGLAVLRAVKAEAQLREAQDVAVRLRTAVAKEKQDSDVILGGQLKTGNLWTAQNRQFPGRPRPVSSTSSPCRCASRFAALSASFAARI